MKQKNMIIYIKSLVIQQKCKYAALNIVMDLKGVLNKLYKNKKKNQIKIRLMTKNNRIQKKFKMIKLQVVGVKGKH